MQPIKLDDYLISKGSVWAKCRRIFRWLLPPTGGKIVYSDILMYILFEFASPALNTSAGTRNAHPN